MGHLDANRISQLRLLDPGDTDPTPGPGCWYISTPGYTKAVPFVCEGLIPPSSATLCVFF